MSLLTRIVNPPEEQAISAHLFMASVAEFKRGAITLADIATFFNLTVEEQAELVTFTNQVLGDVVTREQVHDVLLLGRSGAYSEQFCSTRLLTGSATNILPLIVQKELEILLRGHNDFVLVGCDTTAQGSPDMTLAVAKGAVMSSGTLRAVTAGNVTISNANANMPRIDIVVVTSAGAKAVRTGTASASPQPPVLSAGDVALSFVYVPPADTAISASQLLDCRILRTNGPITVGRATTAVAFNTTSAAQTYVSLSIPNGLLVAGRLLRVSMGGSMLLNSGTPTVTLAISYGGTTMFQDVTGSATADTDRLAWSLDFVIVAQANNDQALNGTMKIGPFSAPRTAPNTGVGEIAIPSTLASSQVVGVFNGASAVDSNSADRILLVQMTMSVANVANEIVMEYAIGELV